MKTNTIYCGDNVALMKQIPPRSVGLIVTDPPYGIGLDYGGFYDDNLSDGGYVSLVRTMAPLLAASLKPEGSLYLVINDLKLPVWFEYLRYCGLCWRNTIIWTYTFGQNQKRKYTPSHANILFFTKNASKFQFNEQLVPSYRSQHGDSRCANDGGKQMTDVWDIPRVVGTSSERVSETHGAQLPLELVSRCILGSSKKGDTVLDPYGGTGTVAQAALMQERNYIIMEINPNYCALMGQRLYNDRTRYENFCSNGVV